MVDMLFKRSETRTIPRPFSRFHNFRFCVQCIIMSVLTVIDALRPLDLVNLCPEMNPSGLGNSSPPTIQDILVKGSKVAFIDKNLPKLTMFPRGNLLYLRPLGLWTQPHLRRPEATDRLVYSIFHLSSCANHLPLQRAQLSLT